MARRTSNTQASYSSKETFNQVAQQEWPIFTKNISGFIVHIKKEDITE